MEHLYVKNLLLKRILNSLVLNGIVALISVSFIFAVLPNANAGEANKSTITNSLFESDSQAAFLSPDEAFKLHLTAVDAENIQASFSVAPGHYLYRERIKFEIKTTPDAKDKATQITQITLPTGEIKEDANFGKQEVYHHDFKANIQLSNMSGSEVAIAATYQGCSEKGLCYAPIKKIITVALNKKADSAVNNAASPSNTEHSSEDDTTTLLKTGNIWLIILGFFGAGLLLSLTPCVLPMIPILSSIIVGSQSQGAHPSKLHSFGLSVAYVLGMALSYTLAGIAAGLSGNLLSQSLQNPWVLGASSLVFVLLALSMFGFYELQLPSTLETKLIKTSNKFKGGQFLGVFVMGALSALIVSPCVAAPLAGALIYIGQSQNVVLGGTALFALSLGMGVPLLLIGASAGKLLPKTGNWMNTVRNFFGVLMLAMAVWLISPVIPVSVQLALWAALLIVTAVFLNALDNLPTHANGLAKFWKGIAVILLIFGITLLIGALSGAKSALQPFNGITSSLAASSKNANQLQTSSSLAFTRIASIAELDQKLAEASGKPVMLDFYADWCVACKELEQLTFSAPKVQQLLKNTTLLQVDVTANSDEDKALLKRFALFGPPGIVFFDGNGKAISSIKTIGFQNAERFTATLAKRDSCIVAPSNNEVSTSQC
jgi:thiol:disulfide interchange protein DsbD